METLLEFDNVSCEFNLFSSLKGISFSLARGESLVIFGTENSGIDGICSLIAGLHSYEGKVLFKGKNVLDHEYAELNRVRRDVVYMQGDYGLISNMTVEENIELPLKYHSRLSSAEIESRVDELIDALHLDYCRDMRPMHLKPSEILKTSYARGIILDPALLLVEHPLEGQCLLNTITFLKNLKKRCLDPECSVIIVTYEPMRFIEFSERFMMFDYGKIVFDGPREMMFNPSHEFVSQFLGFSGDGPMQIW
ncbi:MAG TPA: ATP-binding cassette domain-containing protein [Spirochaetota bacterium]